MSLLSNSLFLDSEYKSDCEYKINYLEVLKDGISDSIVDKDITEENPEGDGIQFSDIKHALEKKVLNVSSGRPYISDEIYLYTTKQISENYYKILIENHAENN